MDLEGKVALVFENLLYRLKTVQMGKTTNFSFSETVQKHLKQWKTLFVSQKLVNNFKNENIVFCLRLQKIRKSEISHENLGQITFASFFRRKAEDLKCSKKVEKSRRES